MAPETRANRFGHAPWSFYALRRLLALSDRSQVQRCNRAASAGRRTSIIRIVHINRTESHIFPAWQLSTFQNNRPGTAFE